MLTAALLAAIAASVSAGPATSLAELRSQLQSAKPGDRVTLAPGTYEGTVFMTEIRGAPGKPIVIAAEDPARPPIIRNRAGQPATEGLHLGSSSHVTVEDLIFERIASNGINVDDGGKNDHSATGITLRRITVRDCTGKGNFDGIKLSGVSDFIVEDCVLQRWGSGGSGIDMVGCRDGAITGCTFESRDDLGSNGVQMKGGSRDIVVRGCRFDHAGSRAINIGGSTGLPYFRPKPEGFEAARITVEGCTMIGSDAAAAFVGVDGATFRFNTVYAPARWALRILQENRNPGFVASRKGEVSDNLFVFPKVERGARPVTQVNVGDGTDAASFRFARNVWSFEGETQRVSLPSAETDGVVTGAVRFQNAAKGDLRPAADGPAAKVGAHALPKPETSARPGPK